MQLFDAMAQNFCGKYLTWNYIYLIFENNFVE